MLYLDSYETCKAMNYESVNDVNWKILSNVIK